MPDVPADTTDRHDIPPPDRGGEVATLDWVLSHVDAHVMPVTEACEIAVMGTAWGLGFAGATRVQVWWVLHDARLRSAFAAVCQAMGRVGVADVPAWLQPFSRMAPTDRAAVAARVEELRADGCTRVDVGDELLLAVVRSDERTVLDPDGGWADVSADALDAICRVARSVTQADLERLLERARPPFQRRLDEAAAVAAEKGVSFHARKAHTAA